MLCEWTYMSIIECGPIEVTLTIENNYFTGRLRSNTQTEVNNRSLRILVPTDTKDCAHKAKISK